jgi:Asp-tRNA(Asn)/Glu-tRNA(Gln) amidotransferase A subunit family amidase
VTKQDSSGFTGKPRPRSFLDAAKGFASGEDLPSNFLERCLAELEASEPRIRAFVHLDADNARRLAAQSDRRWAAGCPRSPIDGMPTGVKDVIETADMPTGMGSPLFDGWWSGRDSASVKALREAGAIILGKTVTTEFASSVPGPTRNPWDTKRTPGGSSSGSAAAVGSGMVSAALGTQVVGSILRPASFCGCVGVKPSLGGINRGGSHDFMSQSCQGVLAASLGDAWQVLAEIVARAGGDPGYPGVAGPMTLPGMRQPRTAAVLETSGWPRASAGAKAAFKAALDVLADSGVQIIDRHARHEIETVESAIAGAASLTRKINAWESRWPMNVYRDRDTGKLSHQILARLEEAERMSVDDYRAALALRASARAAYAELSSFADVCLTLSASGAAPIGLESTGDTAFAAPSSLLGVPAISLPLLADEDLPLGLQVLGFAQKDADLFALSRAITGLLSGAGTSRNLLHSNA